MLLGIYGMFATGKTYAMENYRDFIADHSNPKIGLTIVQADIQMECWLNRSTDEWELVRAEKAKWKGTQDDKVDYLYDMISDRKRLWIVESARYFGGMHLTIVDAVRINNGGVAFIVPYTDWQTARKFLVDRAKKANKVFREEYWDEKRLTYECSSRYINVMNKWYRPELIPVNAYQVDYDRSAWFSIMKDMAKIVAWSERDWYRG